MGIKFEIIICVEEYKIFKKEFVVKFEILLWMLSMILKNNVEIIKNYEMVLVWKIWECG